MERMERQVAELDYNYETNASLQIVEEIEDEVNRISDEVESLKNEMSTRD